MHRLLKTRAGFTLAEVMVALVLTAVIGAAVTGAFISQSRFFDTQEKVSFGRSVSRGALNILMTELRMVERTGAFITDTTQTNTKLTLRVPYAMGIACGTASGVTTYRRLPADTFMIREAQTGLLSSNKPQHGGIAWRAPDETYTYTDGAMPTSVALSTVCTSNAVGTGTPTITGSGAGIFTATVSGDPPRGAVIMLYRRIQYQFKASESVPGRVGLFRRTMLNSGYGTAEWEELVAPFDTTAKFRFYVNDAATAQTAVPATLSTVTGIELTLDGTSERPDGDGTYRTVPLKTSVFFKNRL